MHSLVHFPPQCGLCIPVWNHQLYSVIEQVINTISSRHRRLRKIAACVPQLALLLALHQPLSGRCIGQLFLHHAGYCCRCHCSPKWVRLTHGFGVWLLYSRVYKICSYNLYSFIFSTSLVYLPVRFHSLVIDVTMALDTLSLPVLEPLTPGRLLDVTVLALSCLYAGWITNKQHLKSLEERAVIILGTLKMSGLHLQVWAWQHAWPFCRWAVACSFALPRQALRRKTMRMTLQPLCRNVYVKTSLCHLTTSNTFSDVLSD